MHLLRDFCLSFYCRSFDRSVGLCLIYFLSFLVLLCEYSSSVLSSYSFFISNPVSLDDQI